MNTSGVPEGARKASGTATAAPLARSPPPPSAMPVVPRYPLGMVADALRVSNLRELPGRGLSASRSLGYPSRTSRYGSEEIPAIAFPKRLLTPSDRLRKRRSAARWSRDCVGAIPLFAGVAPPGACLSLPIRASRQNAN